MGHPWTVGKLKHGHLYASARVRAFHTATTKLTSILSQTTIAFGLLAGLFFTSLTFHIIKRIKYQLLVECIVSTVFLTALAACNRNTLSLAIVFSTIGSFPVGIMELTPQVLIQMDSPDGDIGAVYGELPLAFPQRACLIEDFAADMRLS
jgi:hypothetical protein